MRTKLLVSLLWLTAGCFSPVNETPQGWLAGPGADGGGARAADAGERCNAACPVGCDLSPDCRACVPESSSAGIGTACRTNEDCCIGECIQGLCTALIEPATDGGPICGGVGPAAFAGSWSGTASVSMQSGSGNGSSGGGGSDREQVTAVGPNRIEFQPFLSWLLSDCALTASLLPGGGSASISSPCQGCQPVAQSCQDLGGATWTFQSGQATLDPSTCELGVTAQGLVSGSGTTQSFQIDLQLHR